VSAAAALRGWERTQSANTVRAPLALAPTAAIPRVWLYARLLDLSRLSLTGRLLAFLYYRVCRQPPAFKDEDGSLKFHDIRVGYGSRGEARRQCRDGNDVVVGIAYGLDYGPRVAEEVSFCRPEHSQYREQDARDSLIYVDSLEGHFARRVQSLVGQAERVIEQCESA
jgi:hypothetical protein